MTVLLTFGVSVQGLAFYNQPESKKGLLVQHQAMIGDAVELGVKQVVFNITASQAQNEGTLKAIDSFVRELDRNDITVTAIILNDWQTVEPNLLPVEEPAAGASYYAFNAGSQEGIDAISRLANQLGNRYQNLISNWIIGNEVNDGNTWNYLGIEDINTYSANYATAFRTFYDGIKTYNPEARVFIPFDFRWNCPYIPGRYQVKQMLPILNAQLKDTDYGIAWHPYPEDFTNPDFLNSSPNATNSINTPIINMKNLSVLTDYMQRADMVSPSGSVRHLILSEQGFSSVRGEEVQAQSIAKAYEVAKNNPYVEGFYLNRQIDAKPLISQNYYFGLWNCDTNAAQDEQPTTKKQAWYTYQGLV